MSAYVVVHLAPTSGPTRTRGKHAVHGDDGKHATLTHDEVKRLLSEHGAELIASCNTNAPDGEPPQSATIAVADMACANKLAAALREVDGIRTAYAKPGEELP